MYVKGQRENTWSFCLFVCLFVWSLSSHSRIFHSYGDVTIAGEELQIFNLTRHIWLLSSEVFAAATPTVSPDISEDS